MSKEIYTIPSIPCSREQITNKENVDRLLASIKGLDNVVLNFDTVESIEESKQFKKLANKFIKDYKDFSDPFEEEGKAIAKTRSKIKLTLEAIVKDKLAPIQEREDKLRELRDNIMTPASDIISVKMKLSNLEDLFMYDWLGLKDEALPLIDKTRQILESDIVKFEQIEKEKKDIEDKARLEREEAIRLEAEKRGKEQAQQAIDDANKRAEIAEQKVVAKEIIEPKTHLAVEHKKKIHREILAAILKLPCQSNGNLEIDMTFIIKEIANGRIPNLFIKY